MIVKVCGMRDAQNIRDVEQSGADWMGFIFYPRSPRCVPAVPGYLPLRARRIGVFVNASAPDIRQRAAQYGLWGVQLHGGEDTLLGDELRAAGLRVIKACPMAGEDDVAMAHRWAPHADYLLFDTKCSEYGGSGRRFDWSVLSAYTAPTPFLLSGGLRPDSVQAVCAFSHPRLAGVDLNSGFETAPALKDAAALSLFIEQIKSSHKS